mmetsp:Transcript_42836/g.167399  ORF Transcript_42836/g.167399 Transcript_42836/m.167399 type:complete len:120 (-) Transcript_42836:1474-1833(-)
MASGNVPASLKSVGKYLSSAKRYELEGDYITSAYCLIYAAQLVVKQRTGDDPKSTALLEDLMQQVKKAQTSSGHAKPSLGLIPLDGTALCTSLGKRATGENRSGDKEGSVSSAHCRTGL